MAKRTPSDPELKKAFGRQISKWKEEATAANPGASPEDLANIINDMARKQGFDYTTSAARLTGATQSRKSKRKSGRKAARKASTAGTNGAAKAAVVAAPGRARGETPAMSNLQDLVRLLGKEGTKRLIDGL